VVVALRRRRDRAGLVDHLRSHADLDDGAGDHRGVHIDGGDNNHDDRPDQFDEPCGQAA
jgi:hypothetical protein